MLPSVISRLLQSIVAHAYTAYRSYQALQHRRTDELSSWLTYWAILGAFHTAESLTDSFVWWVPFYDECKLMLLLWLVFPTGQGANYLYRTYMQPYLHAHEGQINSTIVTWRNRAQSIVGHAASDTIERVNAYLQELATSQPMNPSDDFEDITGPRIVEIFDDETNVNSMKKNK